MKRPHFKDQILDELAREHNVAQFVSFSPSLDQRYARLQGLQPNHRFADVRTAVETLLQRSRDYRINIRSFEPDQPRSREFIQNRTDANEVLNELRRLAAQGLTTIINETIDVSDGGVSGVATPTTLEFAPDATPRCVEEDDIARMSRDLGDSLLRAVYGFAPEVPTGDNLRVEFSIHPIPRGWLGRHTVLWEREVIASRIVPARPEWPNRFSTFLGDKTYGLLMAHLAGLPVPMTTVISRRIRAYSFGEDTGELEYWLRTCPAERTPGKYTTVRGWVDPFKLLADEDPDGKRIAAVLSQQSVRPVHSGATITLANGELDVAGVRGSGEVFMRTGSSENLPQLVKQDVAAVNALAAAKFGPVSFEWVHDGQRAWIVQLHCGASLSAGDVIYPGNPPEWIEFPATIDIERLRDAVTMLNPARQGVILIGSIGLSSHKGDLLRKAKIPSKLRRPLDSSIKRDRAPERVDTRRHS